MEVNISKGVQRNLLVYQGDRTEDVVNEFSKEHRLNQTKKKKLMEVVKMQLRNILERIEEEDFTAK